MDSGSERLQGGPWPGMRAIVALVGACLLVLPIPLAPAAAAELQGQEAMQQTARGTFRVEIAPEEASGAEDDNTDLGRMSLSKAFEGDLVATGEGSMLTAVTSTEGSAGYVAIERVVGTLRGRSGSFVLQHSGTMSGDEQSLAITIVPDSGTGELEGIAGEFGLEIVDGVHHYELTYTLPEAG